MANPEMITIPLSEYLELREDSEWLEALEAAGVDNWDGISHARELFNKDN